MTLEFSSKDEFTLPQLLGLPVEDLLKLLSRLKISTHLQDVVEELVSKVCKRLEFLISIGLHRLTLDQRVRELSSGEFQRLRISSQLGAGLSGILYIIDEPSRGLHRDDITKLIRALYTLRDSGNTLIMVEHHPMLIRASDWLIDLGPEAGENGGNLLAEGCIDIALQSSASSTGRWLTRLQSQNGNIPDTAATDDAIILSQASLHNLKVDKVAFPIGSFSVLEGPSGAGKSSLITHTLAKYAQSLINQKKKIDVKAKITGLECFDRVVLVDEFAIGRSVRSNPATFTGILDKLRALYASLPLSKERGYQANRFSANVKGGRCEKCLGLGKIKLELHLLSESYVTCDICRGKKYNNETLEVRFKGKNIAEILQSSVDENLKHFANNLALNHALSCLHSVGLGYLKLGQSANTLSGGEAQRIKLATELMKSRDEKTLKGRHINTLYILDEPTLGLYFSDIEILANSLRKLLVAQNTIIAISHNEQFSAYADSRLAMQEGRVVAHTIKS